MNLHNLTYNVENMKDRTNRTIRDGLVVTVVGGLILAGFVYLIQRFYKPFFEWMGLIIDSIKEYLQSVTTISFGVIWLVILMLLALVVFVARNMKSNKASKMLLPDSYTQQLQQEISRLKAEEIPLLSDLAGIDEETTI